jgi:hypothetical protein
LDGGWLPPLNPALHQDLIEYETAQWAARL